MIVLGVVSFCAWFVSILAGGGSPFVLIPLVNMMMGAADIPPVITIGMGVGNLHRMLLFWQKINWPLTLWYAPGAIVGAVLGAYTFTQIQLDWLQLLIGLFLILSIAGFGLEQKETKFHVKAWYILPAGFVKAFVSGLIGTTGPVLNAFYLNYGLIKEDMIATKATHVAIIHIVKIVTYGSLGVLSIDNITAGLVIGLAAIPANLLGKRVLSAMSAQQFRGLVLGTMALSGIWMLWSQRDLLFSW